MSSASRTSLPIITTTRLGLADAAGQLGTTYAIPVIYVPILMITHAAAFILLARQMKNASKASVAAKPSFGL